MVEKWQHHRAAPVIDGAHARPFMLVVSREDDGLELRAGRWRSGQCADEVRTFPGRPLAQVVALAFKIVEGLFELGKTFRVALRKRYARAYPRSAAACSRR